MALMKTVMTIRIRNPLALIVALPALCSAATVNQLTVKAVNRLPLSRMREGMLPAFRRYALTASSQMPLSLP